MVRTASRGVPNSDSVPVRSRKASSTEIGSTSGLKPSRIRMISRDTRWYFAMSTGRNAPCGQRRAALLMGIAERTP